MPEYRTRAALALKDGTIVPRGATLTVNWNRENPGGASVAVWHRPPADGGPRTLKLGARHLGRLVAGRLPTLEECQEWTFDSVCETPSGDTVEPDGWSADGEPSWLLILGLL